MPNRVLARLGHWVLTLEVPASIPRGVNRPPSVWVRAWGAGIGPAKGGDTLRYICIYMNEKPRKNEEGASDALHVTHLTVLAIQFHSPFAFYA